MTATGRRRRGEPEQPDLAVRPCPHQASHSTPRTPSRPRRLRPAFPCRRRVSSPHNRRYPVLARTRWDRPGTLTTATHIRSASRELWSARLPRLLVTDGACTCRRRRKRSGDPTLRDGRNTRHDRTDATTAPPGRRRAARPDRHPRATATTTHHRAGRRDGSRHRRRRAASVAQYVRIRSAPARRIEVSTSSIARSRSTQPLAAAASTIAYSPETLYAATGTSTASRT